MSVKLDEGLDEIGHAPLRFDLITAAGAVRTVSPLKCKDFYSNIEILLEFHDACNTVIQ